MVPQNVFDDLEYSAEPQPSSGGNVFDRIAGQDEAKFQPAAPEPKTTASAPSSPMPIELPEEDFNILRNPIGASGESIKEQFNRSWRTLLEGVSPPEGKRSIKSESKAVGKTLLGALGVLTSPLAPAFATGENVRRTVAIDVLKNQFGGKYYQAMVERGWLDPEKENITPENVFTIAGEDRPTTGSPGLDIVADMGDILIPSGLLFKAGRAGKAVRTAEKLTDISEVSKTENVFDRIARVVRKSAKTETPRAVREVAGEGGIATARITDVSAQIVPEATKQNLIIKASKQLNEPPQKVERVVDSVATTKDKILEYVQDSEIRIKRLVENPDVKVTDVSDPYLKSTLYPGRVDYKITKGKKTLESIVSDLKSLSDKSGKGMDELRGNVHDYLYFSHAPERNARLGSKAAGISTLEAHKGLAEINKLPEAAKIKELAERARKMNEESLDILRDGGVISDDLHSLLRDRYKKHVPLNRIFEETDDIGKVLSGKGYDVRSTGIMRAKGSERQVDDILTNIVANHEQAILRAEKNIVDQSTLAFVRDNQKVLGNLFEIKKPKAIGRTFAKAGEEATILRERTTDPSILQLYENGKKVWIKINDPHLATALRGVNREKLGPTLNAVSTFTRLYSGLATRFNPEFALPNKIRDLQEVAVYLASQSKIGAKGTAKMLLRDLKQESTKAILDHMRGIDSKGARAFDELRSLGGTTGGFGLSTKKRVAMDIAKLEKTANSPTRKLANNFVDYVDKFNSIFEDSTRLSVYRSALSRGLSKSRAAAMAKEASINFNRMGKGGPVINSLWMFSNASIQGTTKMMRSLYRNPKVLGATTALMAGAVGAVNQWNDQVDPGWKDKVSKWDQLNGLNVAIPGIKKDEGGIGYITIPVSWGLKPIKVMTDYAYDTFDGKFSAKNFVNDLSASILEAYNPAGGSDLVSAITPTILDVPVEIGRNQAWYGSKIHPDYDPNAPADIQYYDSLRENVTGRGAISLTEALNKYGHISISPADVKYAYDQYVGGAGRAVSKTVNTVVGTATGEPPPLDEFPMLSRFYRQKTGEESAYGSSKAWEQVRELRGERSRTRFNVNNEAKKIEERWSKEETSDVARKLEISRVRKENSKVADKLQELEKERRMGITSLDKNIKQMNNEDKVVYVLDEIRKLGSSSERMDYLKQLQNKKVISNKVKGQIRRQAPELFK